MRGLSVSLGDVAVGHLRENDGYVSFRLDPEYLDLPADVRPVLGQQFEDDLRPQRKWTGKPGLPAWFANIIPERGTRLRQLLERANGVDDSDIAMLGALGEDLPGATRVRWTDTDYEGIPVAPDDESGGASAGLRFSLAGVQLKFSVLRREDRITLPVKDELGDWILKVDERPGVVENEFVMLAWAKAAGFDVPEIERVPLPDLPAITAELAASQPFALLIRRYDRNRFAPYQGRVHQEDFAQVIGVRPGRKYHDATYDGLARVVRGMLGDDGLLELARRLALMVAMGNADAHLKNWSLLYTDPTAPRWSPAYDLMSTIAWPNLDNAMALKLCGLREFQGVRIETFGLLGEKVGVPRVLMYEAATETITRLREVWAGLPERAVLPVEHAQALANHWKRVPLLAGAGAFPVHR